MKEVKYTIPAYAQFVIKISKLCDLRCKYCYEYPYLADKVRMSLEQIELLFKNLADHYTNKPHIKILDFIWHGGEPFLIEPEYYRQIKNLQAEIFGSTHLTISNKVQTNLTALTTQYIDALKNGLFDSIGVSLDMFGDDRVNIAGKPVQEKVLTNMQKLVDERIGFGCITVLSKKTFHHVKDIYNFFDDIQTPCRFLPIYRTGFSGQHDENMLTSVEVITAFKAIFETWLTSNNAVEVDPISNYIKIALRVIQQEKQVKEYYDKGVSDTVFIVNINGEVYSTDEVYKEEGSYGNIFTTAFSSILHSAGYNKAIIRSREKTAATCYNCSYYGCCSGYEMAEATNEILSYDDNGNLTCSVVKPMIAYIVQRLNEENIAEELVNNHETSSTI